MDQQPFISPQSLLLKTSSGGEVNPSRLVLHTPLPCRPQPIKGSAVSLPWSSPPLSSLMMSPSHKPNVLPFPSLAPAEGLRPGPLSLWHKQGAAKVNPAEQTVLFRLRSLPEHTQAPAKTLERKDKPACWTEKLGAEGPREAYEGPLDLSERGKSTPTDYSPPEPAQDSPEGGPKTEPSPQGSSSSPGSPEEEPAAGSKTQLRSGRLEEQQQHAELENERRTNLMWQQESKEQEQEEMNGMTEQSSDKKVPVLTISLRPGKETRTSPSSPSFNPFVCRESTKAWTGPADSSGMLPDLGVVRWLQSHLRGSLREETGTVQPAHLIPPRHVAALICSV